MSAPPPFKKKTSPDLLALDIVAGPSGGGEDPLPSEGEEDSAEELAEKPSAKAPDQILSDIEANLAELKKLFPAPAPQ